MRVLVVNAGSSSLKLRLVGPDDDALVARDLPARGGEFDPDALGRALDVVAGQVDAVGHRVVHGGTRFSGPVRLDSAVETELRGLGDLAPLHQAESLAGIDAVRGRLGPVPAVACFDTAFHATLAPAASTYAVPVEWREHLAVRRYGFHGLSHRYASRRAAELAGRAEDGLRVVTCHLGAGASLAAVRDGRSVDTTMGFTPLEGLVMATRSGTVDPGMVTWLVTHAGLDAAAVADALEHRSGLLALTGTADMAEVVEAAADGGARAGLGLGVYLHRLRAAVAAMAASMGGLDVLAFTGGVGEHSPVVRSGAVAGLGFMGIEIDEERNARLHPDAVVSAPGAKVTTVVVTAREDLEIARQTRAVLAGGTPA